MEGIYTHISASLCSVIVFTLTRRHSSSHRLMMMPMDVYWLPLETEEVG